MQGFSTPSPGSSSIPRPSLWPVLIVLLGAVLRVYSALSTPIINMDGALYIQQAKALSLGLPEAVTACYPYFSSYPVLIAAAYKLAGNWVAAAKGVSVFFGVLSLLPLWGLLRRFVDRPAAGAALLCFAVTPAFVELSREVIRGPVYWFLALSGLYLFVRFLENRRPAPLLTAGICFLLAAFTRIESLLFLVLSGGFILCLEPGRRVRETGLFWAPCVGLALLGVYGFTHVKGHAPELLSPEAFVYRLSSGLGGYQELRAFLDQVNVGADSGISPYFFPRVRNLLWLVALGALVVQISRAFYHPFMIPLLAGIWGARKNLAADRRLAYLACLSLGALVVLYVQTLMTWAIYSRFVALFLFPAYVFMGLGFQALFRVLGRRLPMGSRMQIACMAAVVLALTLPKDLRARRGDKAVFRDMGRFIGQMEEGRRAVSIAGRFKHLRLVHLYAHLDYPGAPCFDLSWLLPAGTPVTLEDLQRAGFDYFIWDETTCQAESLEALREAGPRGARELGQWHYPKLGRMVLFRIGR